MRSDIAKATERMLSNVWGGYVADDPKTRNWIESFDAAMLDGRTLARYVQSLTDPAPLTLTANELSLLCCIVYNDIRAAEASGGSVPGRKAIHVKISAMLEQATRGNEPLTPQALERLGFVAGTIGVWSLRYEFGLLSIIERRGKWNIYRSEVLLARFATTAQLVSLLAALEVSQ